MKFVNLFLLSLMLYGPSQAQTTLPKCEGFHSIFSRWSNCVGETSHMGNSYKGEFKNNLSHGYGRMEFSNGSIYEGEWKSDKIDGKGKFKFADGGYYEGHFKEGFFHGNGELKSSDGKILKGSFTEGYMNGMGSLMQADGSLLKGDFRNSELTGNGVISYPSGARYVGQFMNSAMDGLGALIKPDGQIIRSGVWRKNVLSEERPVEESFLMAIQKMYLPEIGRTGFSYATVAAQTGNNNISFDIDKRLQSARESLEAEIKTRIELEKKLQKEIEDKVKQNAVASVRQNEVVATQNNPRAAYGARKALVIGNNDYRSVSKLINAKNDALAISEKLKEFGFNVKYHSDLTEREMKSAIRQFKSQVNPGDEVTIFYAGHGVQLGAINYLLPIDIHNESEEQVRDESIPLQRLLEDMSEKKAKLTLALIDACRDNPFLGTGRSIGGNSRGLSPTSAATGQMIVFSAGSGQVALDRLSQSDRSKNGLFTRVLLQEMNNSNLSIDRIIRNVRNEVSSQAKSVGIDQVPAIYDQMIGEFFFK